METLRVVGIGSPVMSNNGGGSHYVYESACSSPVYMSAPSSPGRNRAGFFFSAPASPVRSPPRKQSPKMEEDGVFREDAASPSGSGSDFEFSARFSEFDGGAASADELFCNGLIRPMKLSAHLEKPQALRPLIDLEDEGEDLEEESAERCRERGLCRDKSRHRRTRSLSPLRSLPQWHLPGSEAEVSKLEENEDEEKAKNGEAAAVASSKKGKSGSKRWMSLKDFLYRSKSEGRGHTREKLWALSFSSSPAKQQHLSSTKASSKKTSQEGSGASSAKQAEKFKVKNKNASNSVPNSGNQSNRNVNGPGARRVPVSAHELHYTANRAQAEELRRKTYLPYRQGLFGCLGFSSKSYTTINGFARSLHPTLS
ncbi:hypothetical protein SUGI_0121120 [Cryptomeria japonica]|uniref:uncharacterized protein LOC131071372 n=1 Tax=Cryptomeria japonica TaxID=3369 RepID=UPI0024089376|nr:uncharacterized protein LOC131071372 [Cryptomeria japonica]GLJ10061.1 hypothetical protein SUGI_0121120 [Cryptomeria japonica]